jgi:hypothetical protein
MSVPEAHCNEQGHLPLQGKLLFDYTLKRYNIRYIFNVFLLVAIIVRNDFILQEKVYTDLKESQRKMEKLTINTSVMYVNILLSNSFFFMVISL